MENQEIEIKFYVHDLSAIEARLFANGAQLVQGRVLETNLRFDKPSQELEKSARVLRLRRDTEARLTYKGPAESLDGVRKREEIEFIVSDFRKARQLLEALGYQVSMIYEKYRRLYDLLGTHVALDEMPYGNFVEIEGPDVETIQAVNSLLGLNWDVCVPFSYSALFDQLKLQFNLDFRDLTFLNFTNISVDSIDLGVVSADS
jgi:adenylate cyclase, class 2